FMIATFAIKPSYRASADMLVTNRADSRKDEGVITSSDMTASTNLVNTYSVILKSHKVLEQVIADAGLDYTYAQLNSMVSVSSVDNTQVMRINVISHSSQEALNIVSHLVALAPDAIMRAMDGGSVNTTDDAWTSGKPVSPSKKKWTLIGGLIGLLLSVGAVVVSELLNDKFKTTEDIRSVLDYSILGVIPAEHTDNVDIKKTNTKKKSRK
ncbi:MAG: hypothetical protein IJ875_04550, partial [Solobacterium sp.]|nr:hypothetical protein [Solobacterium sp.]